MIESVRGIVTLRLFNRESARHSVWQSRLTDSINANIHLSRISIWQTTANSLIFGTRKHCHYLARGRLRDFGRV